jgi:hypothetical protein
MQYLQVRCQKIQKLIPKSSFRPLPKRLSLKNYTNLTEIKTA